MHWVLVLHNSFESPIVFFCRCFGKTFHCFFRAALIKMFSPFGDIVSEDFLWHTRGPKRGEPRGYAFIQFRTKEVDSAF